MVSVRLTDEAIEPVIRERLPSVVEELVNALDLDGRDREINILSKALAQALVDGVRLAGREWGRQLREAGSPVNLSVEVADQRNRNKVMPRTRHS
jgi:hypothetical protein